MIIIKIIGGLGNQMFQYAFAKALEEKGHEVKIDISAFDTYKLHGGYQLGKYNIDLEISTKEENDKLYNNNFLIKVMNKLNLNKTIKEKTLLFDKNLLEIKGDNYIDGYFQCEKYFEGIRNISLKQFNLGEHISKYTKIMKKKILETKNTCSIHIRRGDFINTKNISIHGTCDFEYYQKAMNILEEKKGKLTYLIFSDDIEWCKQNLAVENIFYIESEEKRIPHEDIYLMSLCNHNIIANSSFSWWGAWLNQNDKKIVIAPRRWFVDDKLEVQSKNIVCENWIKV